MRRPRQQNLPLKSWGGKRPGAGRPPKNGRAGVSHAKRPALASRYPVHVTLKLRRNIGRLRCRRAYQAARTAFADLACPNTPTPESFRVCQYSVQNHHIHLLVEAKDQRHLTRGMQGLTIRLARRINRAFGREGKVFSERYHAHILKTPRETRNALRYVLNNGLRHDPVETAEGYLHEEDSFSSAAWFDGWRKHSNPRCVATGPPPVSEPKTWLLSVGWRRHGLLVPVYLPPKRMRRTGGRLDSVES